MCRACRQFQHLTLLPAETKAKILTAETNEEKVAVWLEIHAFIKTM
jgi:hypothetical protein|tara:strand:- start:182 stop:319 length:138 start_codon:yes stop_codon:yes gene_type:complete